MPENGDTLTAPPPTPARGLALPDEGQPRPPLTPSQRIPLGEELPIFCERCGYSLNGLTQIRCTSCEVLHFACPECNHHQPINTLRPAVQRVLGRLRAIGLALVVFLKINFFFWTLFMWGGAGMGIAYSYNYNRAVPNSSNYGPTDFDEEGGLILFLFGLAWAAVGRMLLLRWRRGPLIGLALAALLVFAMTLGAYLREWDYSQDLPSPIAFGFIAYMFCASLGAVGGSSVAWGIWLAMAHAFLPRRAAVALVEWQRAMSAPGDAKDRTDQTTSVAA